MNHPHWKQLLTIRYKRTGAGKIQIMSKSESKTVYGFDSPDLADALSLSFFGDNEPLMGERRRELSNNEIVQITSVY